MEPDNNENNNNNDIENSDYDGLLVSRFVTAWELDEPVGLLLALCEAYTNEAGAAGHLLLHPHDAALRRCLFSAGSNNDNDTTTEASARFDRKRLDFFALLLSARPDLRFLQSPESGMTLLHLALYQFAPLPLIQLLASPQLMSYRDASGRTPLYVACHRSQEGVKEHLWDLDPTASRIVDNDNQLPLHLACQQDPLHPIVHLLVQAHPQGLWHRHSKGVTPVLGAFWHQQHEDETHQRQDRSRRQGKLALLVEWVARYPESVRAFNSTNMETALACACRQVYRNDNYDVDDIDDVNVNDGDADDPDERLEADNLLLCRQLVHEYPVALGMAVSMTLASQRHSSLPLPVHIARHYGRRLPLVKEIEEATLQLVRAFVELVLHGTFGGEGSTSKSSTASGSGDRTRSMTRLRTHTLDAIERHCPWIDVLPPKRRGTADAPDEGESTPNCGGQSRRPAAADGLWSGLAVADQVVKRQQPHDNEEGRFPEALCSALFRNYDARHVLKTDAAFRDALCALFRMNRKQQQQQQEEEKECRARRQRRPGAVAVGLWHDGGRHAAETLAAGSGDATALYVRIRETFSTILSSRRPNQKTRRPDPPEEGRKTKYEDDNDDEQEEESS
jgi:hypothetical protein